MVALFSVIAIIIELTYKDCQGKLEIMGNKIDRKMSTEEADRLLGEQFLKEAEEAEARIFAAAGGNPWKNKEKESPEKKKAGYERLIAHLKATGKYRDESNYEEVLWSRRMKKIRHEFRIAREKRPDYIVPFQVTKEDCKKAYGKMMRHAIFAPKELKDPRNVDNFRGIYMPYWVYNITHEGTVQLPAEKSHREGNYIVTDHYNLLCQTDAYYKGLSYDASSSFSDVISENIAPFDVRGMKSFTPSILCGFYADTADVDSDIYLEDAKAIANEQTYSKVKKIPAFQEFNFIYPETEHYMSYALNTECKEAASAMLPVWFLSYRNKDRVAYATVNGQTGKVAADIPVDSRKFLLGSFLLAIPVFLLLNLFFTIRPASTLILSAALALFASIIYFVELSEIHSQETYENDRGYQSKQGNVKKEANVKVNLKPHKSMKSKFENIIPYLFLGVFAIQVLMGIFSSGGFSFSKIVMLIVIGGGVLTSLFGFSQFSETTTRGKIPGFLGALISIAAAGMITFLHPVSDLYYYGGAIVSFAGIIFTLLSILKEYNMLTMRKLPQFNRQGGDDRA